jgi:hypothetical protein
MTAPKNPLRRLKETKKESSKSGARRYRTPAVGILLYNEEEQTTPIARVCLSCKGNYQKKKARIDGSYSIANCRFCDSGLMDQHLVAAFLKYKMKTEDELEKENDSLKKPNSEKSIQQLVKRYLEEYEDGSRVPSNEQK